MNNKQPDKGIEIMLGGCLWIVIIIIVVGIIFTGCHAVIYK